MCYNCAVKSVAMHELKFLIEVITKARVVPVDSSEDEGKDRKKKGKKKKKKPVAKWVCLSRFVFVKSLIWSYRNIM